MARWGKVDFREFRNLQKKMEKLADADFDQFCEEAAKELAARLLAKVIRRTPVGVYDVKSGKKGGTLRRGWTSKSEREAELTTVFGGGSGATKYANSLPIKKTGNVYEIEITNPVHYAPYVEYGHRTRDHKGWVPGRFMLTVSENELDSHAPQIIEKKILKFLGEVF